MLTKTAEAAVFLDRFLQQAELIQITGRSYRLRHAAAAATVTPETKGAESDKESADKPTLP